jgi:hypothetical protein
MRVLMCPTVVWREQSIGNAPSKPTHERSAEVHEMAACACTASPNFLHSVHARRAEQTLLGLQRFS